MSYYPPDVWLAALVTVGFVASCDRSDLAGSSRSSVTAAEPDASDSCALTPPNCGTAAADAGTDAALDAVIASTSVESAAADAGSDAALDAAVECASLDARACDSHPACVESNAPIVDTQHHCLAEGPPLGCMVRPQWCDDSVTYVKDVDGNVRVFGNTCYPPSLHPVGPPVDDDALSWPKCGP